MICTDDEMAKTKSLDMGTFYLIEEKYQKTLDTSIRNPFLHILDRRIPERKYLLTKSPFVSLNHSLNSMHYSKKLVCNVLDIKLTIS